MRRPRVEQLERRLLLSATAGPDLPGGPLLRIDPEEYQSDRILVRFEGDLPVTANPELLQGTSVGRSFPLVRGLRAIQLSSGVTVESALAAYRDLPGVIYAEPDYRLHTTATPNDPRYDELWGMHNVGQTGGTPDVDIDAPEVWEVSTGNQALVAVIDTGVDYLHEDLAANMWVNAGEYGGLPGVDDDGNGYVDDIHGYDFANNDGDPMDDQGHGTHVAGTIAAVGNNGIGVTGVNWQAQIMAIKFLGSDGTGSTSAAVNAINYAVSQGAIISNNSWGGNEPFSQALYDAIAAARDVGHIFVAGAGNGFFGIPLNNDSYPFYPASYDLDNIISVAAIDHNNNLASFSNYGATTVDLAGPGVDILSTSPNNSYRTLSGTSMATPHVAGVIALIRDLYPELSYQQVIAQVLDSTVPNPALEGRMVTGGQLNAAAALPAQEAEIRVSSDGIDITSDGSPFDFGSTLIDLPISKTITITNGGLEELILDQAIAIPAGFTMTSPLSRTNLAFGQSATFELTFPATQTGTFQGTVTILSNDDDEGTFLMHLSAKAGTVAIKDDNEIGFAISDEWGYHEDQGYAGDVYAADPGGGEQWAEWEFPVSPGQYAVSVTYTAEPNRATNAPYTVLDGQLPAGTVRVDQEQTPDDLWEAGASWESLGNFLISDGTLRVRLSNEADDHVIADAVRIERLAPLPAEAEVAVQADGVSVASGTGQVDFGSTLAGVSLTKTILIRNVGSQELVIGNVISTPSGFSVAESPATTVLQPGASTSFTLVLNAAVGGSFSGQVAFATNDSDENPFTFLVSGSVISVQTLDNGDEGFSTAGAWTPYSGQGFQNDIHYTGAGSGSRKAAWSVDLAPGEYQIFATWSPHPNRATNAPYRITDAGLDLGTTLVNQQLEPADLADHGVTWQSLGTFTLSDGALKVELSNQADGYVIADAIRLEKVNVSSPEIDVRLAGQALVHDSDTVGFGFGFIGSPVVHTFEIVNLGNEPLNLGEISLPNGYSLAAGIGQPVLAPGETTLFSIQLDADTPGNFVGEVALQNNDGDEAPFRFEVEGVVGSALIADNGDPTFTTGGSWRSITGQGYQDDVHYINSGRHSDWAAWEASVPPGEYAVSVTYSHEPNRATDAPFAVYDGETPVATVRVDQEQAADDLNDHGAGWENLGSVLSTSGWLRVELTADANEYVIADAIRIERLGDLPDRPEIEVRFDDLALTSGASSLDFGSTFAGTPVTQTITVRNLGSQVLQLNAPIALPPGFSLASPFDGAVLDQGESTALSLQLDADASGSYSGEISISTNDADEDPYVLFAAGSVTSVKVIDDGAAGFSAVGSWAHHSNQGLEGDVHAADPGDGSIKATWEFDVPPGEYQVATTYTAEANRATDAPFVVLDGGIAVGQVRVNQELQPADFMDQGVGWHTLGTFVIMDGAVSIQLSNAADDHVIADALRLERLGDVPDRPEISVEVDGNSLVDGTSLVDFGQALVGVPHSRQVTVRNVGNQPLALGEQIDVPAGFSVSAALEQLILGPRESASFVLQLDATSEGSFSGTVSLTSNDEDENPFSFDVSGQVASATVLDNGDEHFSTSGSWTDYSGQGFQNDVHYTAAGSGSRAATWQFSLTPGAYLVSATWSSHSNRATDAPYTIFDGGNSLGTIRLDQQQTPDGIEADGATWQSLGVFTLDSGQLSIRLTNDANGYVIADAIRVAAADGYLATIADPLHGQSGGVQAGPQNGHSGDAWEARLWKESEERRLRLWTLAADMAAAELEARNGSR